MLAILSYFAQNTTFTIAMLILLVIKLTPLSQFFEYIEKQGLQVAITLLSIAVISPLISGSIPISSFLTCFTSCQSIISIFIGVLVSWLGSRGVNFISVEPTITGALLIGTAIGVAFFNGVPVGPLIAAGIVSLFSTIK